jgi:hypothetical protein
MKNEFLKTQIEPEAVDSKGLRLMFGINRTHSYLLSQKGLIKSYSLKKPGAVKGRRLFSVSSVRSYLESCAQGGAQ